MLLCSLTDVSSSFALRGESYNRTGQHKKTQVESVFIYCDCTYTYIHVSIRVTVVIRVVFSSLPMFTVLRKFTILMTMILEVYILRCVLSLMCILWHFVSFYVIFFDLKSKKHCFFYTVPEKPSQNDSCTASLPSSLAPWSLQGSSSVDACQRRGPVN